MYVVTVIYVTGVRGTLSGSRVVKSRLSIGGWWSAFILRRWSVSLWR
jgi:hypothetical protein